MGLLGYSQDTISVLVVVLACPYSCSWSYSSPQVSQKGIDNSLEVDEVTVRPPPYVEVEVDVDEHSTFQNLVLA